MKYNALVVRPIRSCWTNKCTAALQAGCNQRFEHLALLHETQKLARSHSSKSARGYASLFDLKMTLLGVSLSADGS